MMRSYGTRQVSRQDLDDLARLLGIETLPRATSRQIVLAISAALIQLHSVIVTLIPKLPHGTSAADCGARLLALRIFSQKLSVVLGDDVERFTLRILGESKPPN